MVCQTYGLCVWVAFHENDGNHENDENDKDNSDSYKQGVDLDGSNSALVIGF